MGYEYFDQLVGEKLSAVVFVMDYHQLQFDGPVLTIWTPITVSCGQSAVCTGHDQFRNRLCEQIAKVVKKVQYQRQDALSIVFVDDSTVSISLKPEDYQGPEAMMFDGNSGIWDVIRLDSP